jgi:hypothetical protein
VNIEIAQDPPAPPKLSKLKHFGVQPGQRRVGGPWVVVLFARGPGAKVLVGGGGAVRAIATVIDRRWCDHSEAVVQRDAATRP